MFSLIRERPLRLISLSYKSYRRFLMPGFFEKYKSDRNGDLEDFRSLIVNAASERNIKIVLMEYHVMKEAGLTVPSKLKKRDMEMLMTFSTAYREKYITRTLYDREQKAIKKERTMEKNTNSMNEIGGIQNDLDNRLISDLLLSTPSSFYSHRLAQGAKFGQPLVIDVDYDKYMTEQECAITAIQIRNTFGANQYHCDPFDLYLCNIRNKDLPNSTYRFLERYLGDFPNPKYMMSITEKSYYHIFHSKRKIYLSSNAPETMQRYDHEAIYILGGLVDLMKSTKRSLLKAREEGIQVLKLPLDEHMLFKHGQVKTFSINLVIKILLDLKISGDWTFALRNVPNRKAVFKKDIEIEEALFDRKTKFEKIF